jgi:hypothetical protein
MGIFVLGVGGAGFGYDAAVRYSLLIVPLAASLMAMTLFFVGLKSYKASLGRLDIWLKENL